VRDEHGQESVTSPATNSSQAAVRSNTPRRFSGPDTELDGLYGAVTPLPGSYARETGSGYLLVVASMVYLCQATCRVQLKARPLSLGRPHWSERRRHTCWLE